MSYPVCWKLKIETPSGHDEIPNLRSGSIFVLLCKKHSGGQGETKREPDTSLYEMSATHFFD